MNDTKHATAPADAGETGMEPANGALMSHMPPAGMIATGIASGLAVSAITSTGRTLMGKVGKHPVIVFGLGLAAGYFTHKYRKEILSTVNDAAERGKEFVLQQREHLEDLLAESRETDDAPDAGE